MLDEKLVRFLIVGLANTLIGLLFIYAAKLTGADDVVANAIGYCVGIVISFVLNKQWTFRFRTQLWQAFARFLLVTAFAYAANLFVVLLAIRQFHLNPFVGQALGIPIYTLVSYVGSRYYVFASSR
jgi:putative flippase GtrA